MFDLPDRVETAKKTPIEITWTSEDEPVDLTGATLSGVLRRVATGESRAIVGTIVVTVPAEGIFVWTLATEDVAEPGLFEVQFTATYSGGDDLTYAALWRVLPKLSSNTSEERILSRVLTSSELNPDEVDYIRELIQRAEDDVLVACNLDEWPEDDHMLETMVVDLALWRYNQTGLEGSRNVQMSGLSMDFGKLPASVQRAIPMKRRLY